MAELLSVNISTGGIPKLPLERGEVTATGLTGDGQDHTKHTKPARALSLLDAEVIEQLQAEGYSVGPGALGENLTTRGLYGKVAVGDHLRFSGGVQVRITESRKPCFVLDAVDPRLQKVTIGRLGWMASVVTPGSISPGESIEIIAGSP